MVCIRTLSFEYVARIFFKVFFWMSERGIELPVKPLINDNDSISSIDVILRRT